MPIWEEGHEAAATLGFTAEGNEVHGVVEGRHVSLKLDSRTRPMHVVASGRLDPPLDLGLDVHRREVLLGISNSASTGSVDLDAEFAVGGDEPLRVGELFDAGLRDQLVALHRGAFDVRLHDGGCTISEHTAGGVDAAWLVSVARSVARTVTLLDRARAELRAAAPLTGHVAALRALAAARGLDFTSTPLAVQGRLDGRWIAVGSARTGHGRHHLDVRASFGTELGLGLAVRHRRFLDSVWTMLGGQDLSDDDRHFLVHALPEHADRARAVLDREVHAALAAIDERVGPLTIDDRGVTVDPIPASAAPDVLVWAVDAIDEVRARIEHNLLHGSAGGPYR
jgi:hypothetical protein